MKEYPMGPSVAFGVRFDTETADTIEMLAKMSNRKRSWVIWQLVNIAIPIVAARIDVDRTWYDGTEPDANHGPVSP